MPLIPFPDPLTCQCSPSPTPAVSFGYNGTQRLPSPDSNCAGPGGDTSPRDVFVVMEAPTQPGEELSPQPILIHANKIQFVSMEQLWDAIHTLQLPMGSGWAYTAAKSTSFLRFFMYSILFGFRHFLSFFLRGCPQKRKKPLHLYSNLQLRFWSWEIDLRKIRQLDILA